MDKLQKLLSKSRRAIQDFKLIENGDKIAVGLSGGKDSLTLLYILNAYKRFSPEKFDLIAITLNPGTGADFSPLHKLCDELQVPFYEIATNIKEVVFDIRKEKNPCSLCANIRRGALNTNAKNLGCNKIALGHHKNDAIETLLLSMFYEGRIQSFSPKTYLDKADITLIRPMVYIDELEIKSFIKKNDISVINNPCPANGFTKRQEVKDLTYELDKRIPGFKKNIFSALNNPEQSFLWDKSKF